MRNIFSYFLQGLLYITPFGITAYIIFVIFTFVDGLLVSALDPFLPFYIPGLGIILIFFFLVLVGIIGRSILAHPFKVLFKRLLTKAPLLKLIYTSMNDLFSAFVGKEKKFNKPVIVLINPAANIEKLGFLTEEDLHRFNETDKVAVYFPHSYNFSGELFIVPKTQVRPIDINPGVVMKFIVSGGVSDVYDDPEQEQTHKKKTKPPR